jgi:hypothetical protein
MPAGAERPSDEGVIEITIGLPPRRKENVSIDGPLRGDLSLPGDADPTRFDGEQNGADRGERHPPNQNRLVVSLQQNLIRPVAVRRRAKSTITRAPPGH